MSLSASETERFFGDYRWMSRENLFAHPQCGQLGVDVAASVEQLTLLYPPKVCRELAEGEHGSVILGLFLGAGWNDHVAELLLLGHDLARCEGWLEHTELVAQLRQRDKRVAARFEIGIWAGLRREGCLVEHEPRTSSGNKVADFLVDHDGLRIAIEAKSIGDSDRERNAQWLERAVGDGTPFWRQRGHRVVLTLSPELLEDIDALGADQFFERYYSQIRAGVANLYTRVGDTWEFGDSNEVELLGKITFAPLPRRSPESLAWMLADLVQLRDPPYNNTVLRALRRIRRSAAKQLQALDADIRVAVAWVGRTSAPVEHAADWLGPLVAKASESYRSLDHIVLVNCHRLSRPGWKTEIAAAALPWASKALPSKCLAGLRNWRLCQ